MLFRSDLQEDSLIAMISGNTDKLDAAVRLLSKFDIVETVRTGKVVMARGLEKGAPPEGLNLAAQPHVHDLKAEPGQPLCTVVPPWTETTATPEEAEALGLLSLMLHAHARRGARRSAAGDPVWYLVPDGVVQYISKHRLYREEPVEATAAPNRKDPA